MKDPSKCDLLILGEFGHVLLDVEGSRLLFQVVSDCHEKRSVIFTTNIEFGKWGTVLGDDKLTAALIDRKCEGWPPKPNDGSLKPPLSVFIVTACNPLGLLVHAYVLASGILAWFAGGHTVIILRISIWFGVRPRALVRYALKLPNRRLISRKNSRRYSGRASRNDMRISCS